MARIYESKYGSEQERHEARMDRKRRFRNEARIQRQDEAETLHFIRYTERSPGCNPITRTIGPIPGVHVERKVILLHHTLNVISGTIEVLGGEEELCLSDP